ncbi:vitellogenic carboxypeptidase-like [Planococcus citri]|uniref:vitellogenic carboxypeptidase-like n=1 Tax=Planococcus citri TaxID=170843 RepID=UPI0031F8CD1A
MFSVFGILLLLNYSTTIVYAENNNRERLCNRMNRYSTIYDDPEDEIPVTRNKRSSPSAEQEDPEALFLTPYIENDLIEEAITESRVNEPFSSYESYSGFLTTNNTTETNLFMWYFPCLKNDTNTSLIVWLESGPKYPASSRVFDTAGPFVRSSGKILRNNNTLVNDFNVLYIDSLIGAGFSFTRNPDEGYSRTFYRAAAEVVEALKQFAKMFPQSVQNGLYLNGGDIHTSKIALYLALQLHHHNHHLANGSSGDLRVDGIMIGNGLLDPVKMIGVSDLLYRIGVADKFTSEYLQSIEEEIKRLLRSGQRFHAYEKYQNLMAEVNELGYEQMNDFTATTADNSDDGKISQIFSRVRIKQALHVGQIAYGSVDVPLCYLQQDMFTSVSKTVSSLIPHTKFLFYIGQYGIKVRFSSYFVIDLYRVCFRKLSKNWEEGDGLKTMHHANN